MKRLIQKFREIWSIEELRKRILFTLALLAVYRLGSFIVLPGIDASKLSGDTSGGSGMLGLLNTFTGGSFLNMSILALGIMPYITASIVVQLMTFAVPAFQKMQKEGESGQRKVNQITRFLAVGVATVQAFFTIIFFQNTPDFPKAFAHGMMSPTMFHLVGTVLIVSGTILCMWLGERITDRGIGNGTSLIIGIGIVARLPHALGSEFDFRTSGSGGLILFAVELALLVLVTVATIALIQAVRKIPLQFARAMVQRGARSMPGGGNRDYFPIKLNAAGVMPIIFAQAIMFLPTTLAQYAGGDGSMLGGLLDYKSFGYNALYFVLIIVFTYVYTTLVINPQQQADQLKRNNVFIPGVKPGDETASFIDTVASRITLPGAIALGIIAILPSLAGKAGVKDAFAYFYGGTSLIIMVGVVLDTLQQIETHLLMSQYDGLIKGTRVKGRTGGVEV